MSINYFEYFQILYSKLSYTQCVVHISLLRNGKSFRNSESECVILFKNIKIFLNEIVLQNINF